MRHKDSLSWEVVPIQEHEVLSMRALVTQARTNLAGHARLHKVVFDRAFWTGPICGGWISAGSPLWCPRKTIWP